MKLDDFHTMIKNNVDAFKKDYLLKRSQHPNPDDAYPLDIVPEHWFVQLDIWFRTVELLGGMESNPIYQEKEIENGIEFNLEDI